MKIQRALFPDYGCWLGLGLVLAVVAAFVAGQPSPAWVLMSVLAFVIFAGFKWLTYCEALGEGLRVPAMARFVCLLCWPGMSLKEFAKPTPSTKPASSILHWTAAAAKTLLTLSSSQRLFRTP